MNFRFTNLLKLPVICVIILLTQACVSTRTYNYNVTQRKFAPGELRKDFSVMRASLEEAHPGIYWYISKQDLDFKFDSVYNTLTDSITMMEFYKRAAPVVAQLRCGHTRLLMLSPRLFRKELKESKAKGKSLLNDLEYRIEDDKLYVIKNPTANKLLKPGDELVSVNNKAIRNILDTARTLFSSDGFNTTHYDRALEKNPYGWYRLFNKQADTLHLQIRDSTGLKDTVYIRKISNDTSKLSRKNEPVAKPKKIPRYKGQDEHGKPLLDLTYLNSDSTTALLKVRSFSFTGDNHNRFYRESFADIRKNHVNNLILDLRYNGGGTLLASRNLFSYLTDSPFVFLGKTYANKRFYKAPIPLIYQVNYYLRSLFMFKKDAEHGYIVNLKGSKPLKPEADNYTGNLEVLINGYTFSASSLLSANLKEINRATFIGEETGGGFNECSAGQLPLIKLPNTNLILRLPLYRLAPDTSTPVKGRGVFPDVELVPKVSELKDGTDPEVEKAMEK